MLATSLSGHLSGVGPLLLPPLVDAASEGTGILLVTALTARLLRRASAAGRHLVWLLGVLGLLLLPILSAALPGW